MWGQAWCLLHLKASLQPSKLVKSEQSGERDLICSAVEHSPASGEGPGLEQDHKRFPASGKGSDLIWALASPSLWRRTSLK